MLLDLCCLVLFLLSLRQGGDQPVPQVLVFCAAPSQQYVFLTGVLVCVYLALMLLSCSIINRPHHVYTSVSCVIVLFNTSYTQICVDLLNLALRAADTAVFDE